MFYYNMIADQDGVPSFAEALVTTRSPQATEAILDKLQAKLSAEVPEARAIVRGLVQGPPVYAPVEIRIVGPSLDTLRTLGDRIRLIMLDVPGVVLARTEVGPGAPKVQVDLSEEKVRLAGLDLGRVARQLEAQHDELMLHLVGVVEAHRRVQRHRAVDVVLGALVRVPLIGGQVGELG